MTRESDYVRLGPDTQAPVSRTLMRSKGGDPRLARQLGEQVQATRTGAELARDPRTGTWKIALGKGLRLVNGALRVLTRGAVQFEGSEIAVKTDSTLRQKNNELGLVPLPSIADADEASPTAAENAAKINELFELLRKGGWVKR